MADSAATFGRQVADGDRFEFGRNWARFLDRLNEDRIAAAEASLRSFLGEPLQDRTFLDIGSGSGLFSLAAMRLGASRVHSLDFDPQSVACTESLRLRFFKDDPRWTVECGSALDPEYLRGLGQWDVVYSWGVLHHTGAMWSAVANAVERVAPGGRLYIALYNDQGLVSKGWTVVKRLYNTSRVHRAVVSAMFLPYFIAGGIASDLARGRSPLQRYRAPAGVRGMSAWTDWHDWLGGLPFEVATPEAVIDVAIGKGFELMRLRTCGGRMGCNEFVFRRRSHDDVPKPARGHAHSGTHDHPPR